MYRFFLFLKRILFVLLFIIIEAVALRHYSNSSSYNQAKLLNVSNLLVGDIRKGINNIRHYFTLGTENRRLTEEIAELRSKLQQYELSDSIYGNRTLQGEETIQPYRYLAGRAINNSITRSENFITINKGTRDGVEPDMAILSNGSIAGYILSCSENFSVGISILNTKFRTSGRILGEDYSGSIFWDGKFYDEVTLTEIPKYATIEVGDTIVSTEYSSIFPPEIKIGTVNSFELINGTYFEARIKLFANMGSLNHVILVDYENREEKIALEREAMGQASD